MKVSPQQDKNSKTDGTLICYVKKAVSERSGRFVVYSRIKFLEC